MKRIFELGTGAKHSKGFSLVMFTLGIFMILAFMGLAVDAGTLFLIKGRLSAAVDAAALGAGRSLSFGSTIAQAQANASTQGIAFFKANFPTGYMGTAPLQNGDVTSTFIQDMNGSTPTGILKVNVSATVHAPLYFARMFGYSTVDIASTGTAARKGLGMMLVLDISSSMGNGAGSSCAAMVAAAQNFINRFSVYDKIGLIAFESTAHLKYAPSASWKSGNALYNAIGALTCTNNTNTTGALHYAYDEIKNVISQPLALNAIVLFTDGIPNGVTANYPVRAANLVTGYSDVKRYGITSGPTGFNSNSTQYANLPTCIPTATLATTWYGTIAQWMAVNVNGALGGPFSPTDEDSPMQTPLGNCASLISGNADYLKEMVDFIPDQDYWGNSTHFTYANGTGGSVDQWLFDANNQCPPALACKRVGQDWTTGVTPASGGNNSGSNLYKDPGTKGTLGSGPRAVGKLRIDQGSTLVLASMATALNQANTIREDSTYNTIIHTIYLQGNASDPIDRQFLPRLANFPVIPPTAWDNSGTWTQQANPDFTQSEQQGMYLQTTSQQQLNAMFNAIASSLLRISQ